MPSKDAALADEVVSAVAIGNLKAISEQPAMLSNLTFANSMASTNLGQQNAVSNQRSVSELAISTLARGVNTVSNLGPLEARSAVDVLSNNELAQTIADLKSVVEAFAESPTPSGGGGRQGHGSVWKLLRELLKRGLRLEADGVLVVPAPISIRIPGQYRREQFDFIQDNQGITIRVRVE